MNRLLLPLLLAVSVSIFTQGQDLSLRFDDFPPTKDTSVQFSTNPGGAVAVSELQQLSLRSVETQDHKYVLLVNTGAFERGKYNRFLFHAYLRTPGNPKTVQHFIVYEDPIGPFRDSISAVTFHVNGPSGEDVGKVNLPLHSDNGSDNVSLALPKAPLKVVMSGPSTLTLGVANNLAMHILVNETRVSSKSCPNCWLSVSAAPNRNDMVAQGSTSLIISVRPNTLRAFLGTVFSLNRDVPHDNLLITLSSSSEQGGLPTPQEFDVPVRFAPTALYLLAAALAGALLGGTLRLLMPLPQPAQPSQPAQPPPPVPPPSPPVGTKVRILHYLKEYGTSIGLSFVVWLLMLMLYSYVATGVKLFGFDLDPSQLVPAGLITVLVAGGPPVVAKIKEALGR